MNMLFILGDINIKIKAVAACDKKSIFRDQLLISSYTQGNVVSAFLSPKCL